MKSTTLSSPEDKNIVRKALPTSKIFTAAVARLYVANPDPSQWSYSRVWGAAAFCIDKAKNNSFFIRIIDLEREAGVIWEQELYEGFEYVQDAPFFHTFETDDCLTGLEFVSEEEAETFYKKVQNRQSLYSKVNDQKENTEGLFGLKKDKRKSKIDKNHIGMPADFRHLSHIGYTPGKGFSVQNNDPELNGILSQLQALGISAEEINENQEFIQEFLQQNNQQQQQQQQHASPAPSPIQRKKAPPPPPPPGRLHGAPPPPPPPRRPTNVNSSNGHPVSSPPPPPPSRSPVPPPPSRGRPAPPPPPVRNNANSTIPPPPMRPHMAPPAPPSVPAPPPPPPVSNTPRSGVPPPTPKSSIPVPPPPPGHVPAPPPMPKNNIPVPPPPPPSGNVPAPPPMPKNNIPVPPPPSGNAPVPPPMPGNAPPTAPIPVPAGSDGRSDLMASIRAAGGFGNLKSSGKLKKAATNERSPILPTATTTATAAATGAAAGAAGGDLASSLANVLKQRKQAMQSDDEDDDEDEWE
ncbi:hypothetical protein G6F71_002768 [Rhizopus microsporus]|nr:hypothetical protein G6F71_002768 [Rhizopus microsporus]